MLVHSNHTPKLLVSCCHTKRCRSCIDTAARHKTCRAVRRSPALACSTPVPEASRPTSADTPPHRSPAITTTSSGSSSSRQPHTRLLGCRDYGADALWGNAEGAVCWPASSLLARHTGDDTAAHGCQDGKAEGVALQQSTCNTNNKVQNSRVMNRGDRWTQRPVGSCWCSGA